jgi:hypothetical protein
LSSSFKRKITLATGDFTTSRFCEPILRDRSRLSKENALPICKDNTKLVVLSRFFKWLHYPKVDDPKRRNELSILGRKPDCIMDIKRLKRKEISCYKPSDL